MLRSALSIYSGGLALDDAPKPLSELVPNRQDHNELIDSCKHRSTGCREVARELSDGSTDSPKRFENPLPLVVSARRCPGFSTSYTSIA